MCRKVCVQVYRVYRVIESESFNIPSLRWTNNGSTKWPMFAESRTVWFDWKVRLFKGPTQFPLYMDIAIYLTSVEWFDQHFPCSSMNQLFVDFSNYIDIAIKFSRLPNNKINNQNRREKRETRSDFAIYIVLHSFEILVLKCLKLMLEIALSINLSLHVPAIISMRGSKGKGGCQDPLGKFKLINFT